MRKQQHKKKEKKREKLGAHHPFVSSNDKKKGAKLGTNSLAPTSINNKTLKQEKEEAPSSLDKVRMTKKKVKMSNNKKN